ncbi:MAG: hypothetical protein ACXVCP_01290 [Bdellovibrio sp.]
MDRLNKFFLLIFCLGFLGCGVKGIPLPPLKPAPLGHGEPTLKQQASSKKVTPATDDDDLENKKSKKTED